MKEEKLSERASYTNYKSIGGQKESSVREEQATE